MIPRSEITHLRQTDYMVISSQSGMKMPIPPFDDAGPIVSNSRILVELPRFSAYRSPLAACRVISITLPSTYHTTNLTNNSLRISADNFPEKVMNLRTGNYDIQGLLSEFNYQIQSDPDFSQLAQAGLRFNLFNDAANYMSTFNTCTQKYEATLLSNIALPPITISFQDSNSAKTQFGIEKSITITPAFEPIPSFAASRAHLLLSDRPVETIPTSTSIFVLKSNMDTSVRCIQNNPAFVNVLQYVNVPTHSTGNSLSWAPNFGDGLTHQVSLNIGYRNYTFWWTDLNDFPINFQGGEWMAVLEFVHDMEELTFINPDLFDLYHPVKIEDENDGDEKDEPKEKKQKTQVD